MVILYQGPTFRLNGKRWEKAWFILTFEINFLHLSIYRDKLAKKEIEKKVNFTTNGDDVRFGSTTLNIPNMPKIDNDTRVHQYCYMAIQTDKIIKKKTIKKISWYAFPSTNEMFKFIRTCTVALNYINVPAPSPNSQENPLSLHKYKPEPYRVRNNWDRFYDNPPSFSNNSTLVNKSVSLDALHAMTQNEDYDNRMRVRSNSENNLKRFDYESDTDDSSSITYQPMYVKAPQTSGTSLVMLQRKKELDEHSISREQPTKSYVSRPKSQMYEKVMRKQNETIPDQIPTKKYVDSSYERRKPDQQQYIKHSKHRNSFDSGSTYLPEPMDIPPEVISVIYGTNETTKKYSPVGIDLNPILYKRIDKEDYPTTYTDTIRTFNRRNSMKKGTSQIYRIPVKVMKNGSTSPISQSKSYTTRYNNEPSITAIYKDSNESEKIPIQESDGKFYAIPLTYQTQSESRNSKMITEIEEKIKETKKSSDEHDSIKIEDNVVMRTRKSSLHSIQIEDENGKQEIMKEQSTFEIRYD